MRKPRELKTRLYVARVTELNNYLNQFPPYAADQSIPQDELMDIFEFSMPATWQKQAIIQGFDIMQHTPNEFVEFCERLEGIEDEPDTKTKNSNEKTSQNKHGKNKRRHKSTESSEDKHVCMLHGPGHSTNDCKVLRTQAKRMKASYDAQTPEGKRNWKKTNETNAIIEAVVEKLQAKKRKNKQEVQNCEAEFSNLRVSSDSESSDNEWLLGQEKDTRNFSKLDELINYAIEESYSVRNILQRPHKKRKVEPKVLSPITFGVMNTRLGKPKTKNIKILLDSGSSGMLVHERLCTKLRTKPTTATEWQTASGSFTTKGKVDVQFALPEFHTERKIQ